MRQTNESDYALIDTDVYSYLMRPGDPRAQVYRPHVQGKIVAVSFITVGELLFGAKKKKWGTTKVDDLKQRLRSVVVVPYDYQLCATYGDLKAAMQSAGIGIADNDLWIAASAVRHSIPLISNNRKHYERVPGLVLISEAAVITEIQAQRALGFPETEKAKSASSSEPPPPASQSSSDS